MRSRALAVVAAAVALGLVVSGCNATTVSDLEHRAAGNGNTKHCGTFNLAVNAWVGYEADAAVVSYLARKDLGCTVKEKHIDEQVSWQGFGTGQVDAILENWGHDDLKKQYIQTTHVAQEAGQTGLQGVIGWYVPPWMAKKYPDITNWRNLNKYASMFRTTESGGKGQLLDGDPSYVTNDAALVKNLHLNYKVVQGGSETSLITSYRQAEQKHTPLLAYFYSPQWFLNEVPLVKVNLPKYTPGCDANPAKIACDYPAYNLDKIVSTKFAKSGSPAYTLVKNFKWSNADQNTVAKYIAVDKMTDDQAAKKWLDAHPDVVSQWLAGTGAGGTHKACGTFNLAVNAWVGYEADAAVVSYLARKDLGCTVKEKHIDEQVSWQGFGSGQVDAILENWGHDDLKKQYIQTTHVAQEAGQTGLQGVIGWYVPPWMKTKYPDITDWHSLNKYASLFKTSESGGKGQLLDGDPSYVTNDAALVKNLHLNYKVVQGGSETSLITSFRQAEQKHTPLLAYFYSPQWFLNEVPLVKVNLPKYTPGCDANPAKIACDYPAYNLDKIVSTKFAKSGSPAYTLVKNFHWSNSDQNTVAKYIAVDKMTDDQAAKKWLDAHPDVVAQWLAGTTTAAAATGPTKKCGTFNLAVNAWVGYEADAAVVAYLAKNKLGCTVKEKHIDEQVSWQGFPTGQVDAILENWGHDDLKKQYIATTHSAQEAGQTGLQGVIGWYVPPWMKTKYPDITDWHSLNKYASLFKTSESGGKGQLLDGDPSYVTNDAALVKNLHLDYKVVQGGSETSLITSFRQAEQKHTPLLAYFYSPQWFLNEVPLVKVNLPKYTPGCDANPAKIACDYPAYNLDKIVSTKFAKSGSPAYTLVKNFHWSNSDQNTVAKYIAVDKMTDDQAAKKWLDAHPDVVTQWLAGTGAN